MKILVTGSSGHLGEALMRILPDYGHTGLGLDVIPGEFTQVTGSICDADFIKDILGDIDAIIHTATLHKPHVGTHSKQQFVNTNITGTLNLLEAAKTQNVKGFVYSSTTSTFGTALSPGEDSPAVWVDESVTPLVKNIYGMSKLAAENLCELFSRKHSMQCSVLRLSRFFPEEDDNKQMRESYSGENSKANEFLYRRVDIEDAATAHICALREQHGDLFKRHIISAPTPFTKNDLIQLRQKPQDVVAGYYPNFAAVYRDVGFQMFPDIERVYVSQKAIAELSWKPKFDFTKILEQLGAGVPIGSKLARTIGKKPYHDVIFDEGPYPVE